MLSVNSIVKRFGDFEAVSKVSFSVEQGTIFGLLGPNGAGKTTTIRMITNILKPDEGEIIMFGERVSASHQNRIGYLPEERGLYKKIKVIDQLIYFGMLKGMTRSEAQSEARKWLKKLDAGTWESKKIQELSKGMQQKVQFISTILHEPDVLILDEPFSGFDPINTEIIKKIVMDLKEEGKTIILSTHIMEQVEQLCDHICLIDTGKPVLSGLVREIKRAYGRDTIIMEWDGDDSFLNDFQNIKFINRSNNRAEFRITDGLKPMQILQKASLQNNIYKFELAEPSLNEIFIDVVTKQGVSNES
ncbi:MAG: ATP-binding cassette domain-containing protein [Bacteroidetes bacterium]|nr:MAG: ATP-binding cassette domain-containing protein [Bacteroidota bacterium]